MTTGSLVMSTPTTPFPSPASLAKMGCVGGLGPDDGNDLPESEPITQESLFSTAHSSWGPCEDEHGNPVDEDGNPIPLGPKRYFDGAVENLAGPNLVDILTVDELDAYIKEMDAKTADPAPQQIKSRLNPQAPAFVPAEQARPTAPPSSTDPQDWYPEVTETYSQTSRDFLEVGELVAFLKAIRGVEERALSAFEQEVKVDPSAAFRRGPSNQAVVKARVSLAALYQGLSKTIRKLGFHEQAIVVPPAVRTVAHQTGQGFHPFGQEDWTVGNWIYETRSGRWFPLA